MKHINTLVFLQNKVFSFDLVPSILVILVSSYVRWSRGRSLRTISNSDSTGYQV